VEKESLLTYILDDVPPLLDLGERTGGVSAEPETIYSGYYELKRNVQTRTKMSIISKRSRSKKLKKRLV